VTPEEEAWRTHQLQAAVLRKQSQDMATQLALKQLDARARARALVEFERVIKTREYRSLIEREKIVRDLNRAEAVRYINEKASEYDDIISAIDLIEEMERENNA